MTSPRIFFDGDTVPAGTWVIRVEVGTDGDDFIHQLDPDDDCDNGNLGPLVEVVLPADLDQSILSAAKERGIKVDYCTTHGEWMPNEIAGRSGADTACYDCASLAERGGAA